MKKIKDTVCVNLGSGPSGLSDWVNYDWGLLPLLGKLKLNKLLSKIGLMDKGYGTDWPPIVLRDIRKKLPFEDDSVDYIYCSHVLEHFEKFEAESILKECRRVLGRKGVIRVVLPDLEVLVKSYNDPDNFNRIFYGFNKDQYNGVIGRFKRKFIRPHQWMYTKDSFKKMLIDAGFENIVEQKMGIGQLPDLDKLDLEIHQELSFYIEAGN